MVCLAAREIGEALEALAVDRTLVLLVEDLHWSDTSSVNTLAYLAQRTVPARLLIIGSYCPVEVATRDHPLRTVKLGLEARRRCTEIAL
jgi:predicted ATPase